MNARATALLGLALGLTGLAFGSPSLLVAGFGVTLLALATAAWVAAAAAGAAVLREPGPRRIVEGDTYPLRLRLRRRVPPPGGELRDQLLDESVPVGPLRPNSVEAALQLPRRGRYMLSGATWAISDPFEICTRRVRSDPGDELLVLPRVEPLEIGPAGGDGIGIGSAPVDRGAAAGGREARAVDFEIDGLRRYRAGAPASRIHWPALARSGQLYERRLVAGSESLPLIVLDAERPDDADSLDRAVRAAASLAIHLARAADGCSLLLPGRSIPQTLDARLRAWPELHAQLAVVAAGSRTPVLPRSAQRGTAFWVTAGAPEQAMQHARQLGGGPHYLVSARPCEPGRVAFQVAGCVGFAVSGGRPRAISRSSRSAA